MNYKTGKLLEEIKGSFREWIGYWDGEDQKVPDYIKEDMLDYLKEIDKLLEE